MDSLNLQVENLSQFYQDNLGLLKEESVRKAKMFLKNYTDAKSSADQNGLTLSKIQKDIKLYFACDNQIPQVLYDDDELIIECRVEDEFERRYGDHVTFLPKVVQFKEYEFAGLYAKYTKVMDIYNINIKFIIKTDILKEFFNNYLNFPLFSYIHAKYDFMLSYTNIEAGCLYLSLPNIKLLTDNFNLDAFYKKIDNIVSMEEADALYRCTPTCSFNIAMFVLLSKYKPFFKFFFKVGCYFKEVTKRDQPIA